MRHDEWRCQISVSLTYWVTDKDYFTFLPLLLLTALVFTHLPTEILQHCLHVCKHSTLDISLTKGLLLLFQWT